MSWLGRFEQQFKPFSADEAWLLFRVSAYGEAVGWTLLITGIVLKHSLFHGNDLPVLIAGQIHGTLFVLYMAACILTYPSQSWSRWRVLFAVAASVPPYGSIVFEQTIVTVNNWRSADRLFTLSIYRLCIKI